jgi:hypothetical protein
VKFKQRIHDDAMAQAIGLEVHVDGWGTGPFFTVRGFDKSKGEVLLSTRYSHAIKYRVQQARVYFTRRGMAAYTTRMNKMRKAVSA